MVIKREREVKRLTGVKEIAIHCKRMPYAYVYHHTNAYKALYKYTHRLHSCITHTQLIV